MTSCTIIISHYESLPFIHACIRQIAKYSNPEVETYIIICDQSKSDDVEKAYGGDWGKDVTHFKYVHVEPFYSGYGIDWILRNVEIKTEYICQIHADAFPVHKNWLSLPIKLIEENDFSFVGQLQVISNENDKIYYNNKSFFAMAQCYNVAKTETYKEMSLEAGFTRFHQRVNTDFVFNNNDWAKWAEENYWARGSDDDIVAFAWESNYRDTNKLGLSISGFIQANFGRVIDDLVFHFCSANESRGVDMGEQYNNFTKRINENYDDALIDEMVTLAKANRPSPTEILSRNVWSGTLKKSFPSTLELDKRIEELKNN